MKTTILTLVATGGFATLLTLLGPEAAEAMRQKPHAYLATAIRISGRT